MVSIKEARHNGPKPALKQNKVSFQQIVSECVKKDKKVYQTVINSKKNLGKWRECVHYIGGFLDIIIKDNGST